MVVWLLWAPVPLGEGLFTWLHHGQQKGAARGASELISSAFPICKRKGDPSATVRVTAVGSMGLVTRAQNSLIPYVVNNDKGALTCAFSKHLERQDC